MYQWLDESRLAQAHCEKGSHCRFVSFREIEQILTIANDMFDKGNLEPYFAKPQKVGWSMIRDLYFPIITH